MLIFVGFAFSGGMPIIIIFTFIGLFTRYILYKHIFVRYSKIPAYYTDSMNDRARLILQMAIILHMGISIWMFGNYEILGSFNVAQVWHN